jgi:hypothetical protein
MANLLVDEARLSPNFFQYTNDETAALLSNYDTYTVRLPNPHIYTIEKDLHDFYRTEMYFFV